MINRTQIRAARALIEMTQKELASKAGLSTVIINRIEKGETNPRGNTISKIEKVLESAGIEFLPGSGVRLRAETVQVQLYDGTNAYVHWQQEYFATRLSTGCEGCFSGVDEIKFINANPSYFISIIDNLKQNALHERVLFVENDRFFVIPPPLVTYRWAPQEAFGKIPTITYGNKVAFIFWGPPLKILVVENPLLADTFQRQFEFVWRLSKKPPFTDREIMEIAHDNVQRILSKIGKTKKKK